METSGTNATTEAHVLAMLEDALRALYAARYERRDGEDTRVMSVQDWEAVRDAVAAAIAALAMQELAGDRRAP